MITGPVIVRDFKKDFKAAVELVNRDYGNRYQNPNEPGKISRPLLDTKRSLGSVIRLFTRNASYTDAYNEWLTTIPRSVRDLAFVIKRLYKSDWGDDWFDRFSVDLINGRPGNELIYQRQKLITQYLRVGFEEDGTWRTFGLRKDFSPAKKIQTEDDITATSVVPTDQIEGLHPDLTSRRSSLPRTVNTASSSVLMTPSSEAMTSRPKSISVTEALSFLTTSRSRVPMPKK